MTDLDRSINLTQHPPKTDQQWLKLRGINSQRLNGYPGTCANFPAQVSVFKDMPPKRPHRGTAFRYAQTNASEAKRRHIDVSIS
jgi:hypothetical protein